MKVYTNDDDWLASVGAWLDSDELSAKEQANAVNSSASPQQCLYSSAKSRLTGILSNMPDTADARRRTQELALESSSAAEFGDLLKAESLDWALPDQAQRANLWSAVQEVGDLFCSVKPAILQAPDSGKLVHVSEMPGSDPLTVGHEGPWYIVSSTSPNKTLEGPFKNMYAGKDAMHNRLARLLASSRENQQEDVQERLAIQKYICESAGADDVRAELLGLGMSPAAIAPLLQKADRLKPKAKINPMLADQYAGMF